MAMKAFFYLTAFFLIGTVTATTLFPIHRPTAMSTDQGAVYIVHLDASSSNSQESVETCHVNILTSVFGSEAAARDALLYSYKNSMNGFSAKLTQEQMQTLSNQPGVVQIVPSQVYHLHTSKPGFGV